MNINELPAEILSEIFLHTSPEDWIYNLPHVCKKWKKTMSLIWEQVQQLEYEGTITYRLTLADGRTLSMNSRSFNLNEDELADVNYRTVHDGDLNYFIDVCANSLKSLTLYIPQASYWIKDETILLIGAACKSLRKLTLTGDINTLADSLTLACQDLPNLEEISINDESQSTVDEQRADGRSAFTVSTLFNDILSSCTQLRLVNGSFSFNEPPPSNVFRLLEHLPQLTSLSWIVWQATSPRYVEEMLTSLTRCSPALTDVELLCEVMGPLNGPLCRRCMQILGEEKSVETLNVGFQLLLPELNENGEDAHNEYFDSVDEAPWTEDFFSSLTHFARLRQLTLRSFDFSKPLVLTVLQKIAARLTSLRFEDNYNITETFFYSWRVHLPLLKAFTLVRANCTHVSLTEFLVKCPRLTSVVVSDIEGLSFKNLVLSLREYLHICCHDVDINGTSSDDDLFQPLAVRLDTAPSFRHNEAEGLRNVQLCGLKTLENRYSRVEISRKCAKKKIATTMNLVDDISIQSC